MKTTLVKFQDGRYGYRKFSLFYLSYVFLDLRARGEMWWDTNSTYYNDCKGDLDILESAIKNLVAHENSKDDVGEVVDIRDMQRAFPVPNPATASSVPIAQPMSERERTLYAAARNAAGTIKLHLWRYNVPSDKWPEGSWAADDARDAHKQLKAALAAYEGEGK